MNPHGSKGDGHDGMCAQSADHQCLLSMLMPCIFCMLCLLYRSNFPALSFSAYGCADLWQGELRGRRPGRGRADTETSFLKRSSESEGEKLSASL